MSYLHNGPVRRPTSEPFDLACKVLYSCIICVHFHIRALIRSHNSLVVTFWTTTWYSLVILPTSFIVLTSEKKKETVLRPCGVSICPKWHFLSLDWPAAISWSLTGRRLPFYAEACKTDGDFCKRKLNVLILKKYIYIECSCFRGFVFRLFGCFFFFFFILGYSFYATGNVAGRLWRWKDMFARQIQRWRVPFRVVHLHSRDRFQGE